MKIKIDRDLCTGIGNCIVIAPTALKLDQENKVTLLDAKSVDENTLMRAAESCPVNAITIEDDQGNQLYP